MSNRTGWEPFAEWALALALLTVSVLGAASIGIFVVPFALLALFLAGQRNRAWPELLGGLVGVGSVLLYVAYRNRNYLPCPVGPMRVLKGQHFSCGGFDPTPWLALGLLFVASGFAGYLVFRRTVVPAATT